MKRLLWLLPLLLMSCSDDDKLDSLVNTGWKCAFEANPNYKYYWLTFRENDFSYELYINEERADSTGGSYKYDNNVVELTYKGGSKASYSVDSKKMNLINSTIDAPGMYALKTASLIQPNSSWKATDLINGYEIIRTLRFDNSEVEIMITSTKDGRSDTKEYRSKYKYTLLFISSTKFYVEVLDDDNKPVLNIQGEHSGGVIKTSEEYYYPDITLNSTYHKIK
jgi:hypothetical protein